MRVVPVAHAKHGATQGCENQLETSGVQRVEGSVQNRSTNLFPRTLKRKHQSLVKGTFKAK